MNTINILTTMLCFISIGAFITIIILLRAAEEETEASENLLDSFEELNTQYGRDERLIELLREENAELRRSGGNPL